MMVPKAFCANDLVIRQLKPVISVFMQSLCIATSHIVPNCSLPKLLLSARLGVDGALFNTGQTTRGIYRVRRDLIVE